ncbi:MAG: endonuclease/exonuclease/phosphatase family protein [Actinobacteria bacterium]|nr:endonuclease/exonuclease/phosphatase family protein [Actinomycetota bacterium]
MTPPRTAPATARPVRRRPTWPAVLAALYAAATVAALVAWTVAGDAAWIQPVNLSTFWWSLPGVVLAPLALLLGGRRTAALLAVPAVLWLWSYGTAFLPDGTPDVAADLRVVSFNTYVRTPDAGHVLELVEETDPDVLVLQEVFPPRETELDAALAAVLPHRHVVQSPGVGGVAVYARFPIAEVRPIGDASERSRSTAVVVLDVDGRPLQVVPVHLISPCPTCGTSFLERLDLEGEVRVAEMGSIVAALDPDVPAIVAGDLNSTDRSMPYRRLAGAGFTDPQRDAGHGPGFTWPADDGPGAFLRIDWMLVRDLRAVEAWVGPARGSDHRPVIADLAFTVGPDRPDDVAPEG